MTRLVDPTNDLLDEAIIKVITHWEPTKQSIEASRSWAACCGGDESDEACYAEAYRCDRPRYSESADAILPLLYQEHWEVNQTTLEHRPIRVVIYRAKYPGFGESDRFPRAAAIALLRANGVEIEFTQP